MCALTQPSLLKITDPKLFSGESAKNIIENFFKNLYVCLGTTASGICPIKSQEFPSSVSFNVIEMV